MGLPRRFARRCLLREDLPESRGIGSGLGDPLNPYLALGVSPREALFLDQIARFDCCWAAMSWLAKQLQISVRHAFRLQAGLISRGLLISRRQLPGSTPPPNASRPERLGRMMWAVRSLGTVAIGISEGQRARVEAWRQARQAKIDSRRADAARKREARERDRAARQADANPAPPPAPYTREFPVAAPSGPVSAVPAAVWALFRRPPPE